MTTACIWAALADARRAVAEVVADGRGEAPTQRGGVREFSYPTAQAVAAAATPALLGAGLMLVPLRVDAVTNGLGGAELPIVFALVHAEADEVLEFPLVWPLANPADYAGGRPQAQAATITMAECHLLRHLLAIRVRESETAPPRIEKPSAAARHGKTLDDLGAMPDWNMFARERGGAQQANAWEQPAPPAGPPKELEAAWLVYRRNEFLPRSSDPNESVLTWPELVGRALNSPPRECLTAEEQDRVASYLRFEANLSAVAPWRALVRSGAT